MTITDNLPYNAKFDPANNFVKVLFKPKFFIQSRELIEMQQIVASQLADGSSNILENGSIALGGAAKFKLTSKIKVQGTFDYVSLIDKTLVTEDLQEFTVTGYDDANKTLYIVFKRSIEVGLKPGDKFLDGINIVGQFVDQADFQEPSIQFSVEQSVYFINKKFVLVEAQSIVPALKLEDISGSVGFKYTETAVTAEADSSLYEPNVDSNNFGGIGADRLRASAELIFLQDGEVAPNIFVEVFKIVEGVVRESKEFPSYAQFGDTLARRTYDESGSYTVTKFLLDIDNVDSGFKIDTIQADVDNELIAVFSTKRNNTLKRGDIFRVSGVTGSKKNILSGKLVVDQIRSSTEFTVKLASLFGQGLADGASIVVKRDDYVSGVLSPGKAYVRGYEYATTSAVTVPIRKATDTKIENNKSTYATFGNSIVVENLTGILDPTHFERIELKNAAGDLIGLARYRAMTYVSLGVYRIYLLDINVTGTFKFSEVRSIHDTITGADADISALSIKNAKTTLTASNVVSTLYAVSQGDVKTFEPARTPTLSYVETQNQLLNVAAGVTTISLKNNEKLIGSFNINIAAIASTRKSFIFLQSDGTELVPDSLIISANGRTAAVTFNPVFTGTVNVLISVRKSNVDADSKRLSTTTKVILAQVNTQEYDLGVPDCVQIVKVTSGNNNDITSRFVLNSGQTSTTYEHGSITIVSGSAVADTSIGQSFHVEFEHFVSTGNNPFTVDSYEEDEADQFTSNFLDFRLVADDNSTGLHGVALTPETDINYDYEWFLLRRDLVVLQNDGSFIIKEGTASAAPVWPVEPTNGMALYRLQVYPTKDNNDSYISVTLIDNRRYRMSDIHRIDKRINRLEYESELSLLEMQTQKFNVRDASGLDRFKNGFLVDNFTEVQIRGVDHICGIDPAKHELRPAFQSTATKMGYNASESTDVNIVGNDAIGKFATLPFTEVDIISIITPTAFESINPFLIYTINGTLMMNPASDDWKSETRLPTSRIDVSQGMATIARILNNQGIFETRYSEWENGWVSAPFVDGVENSDPVDVRGGSTLIGNIVARNNANPVVGTAARENSTVVQQVIPPVGDTQTVDALAGVINGNEVGWIHTLPELFDGVTHTGKPEFLTASQWLAFKRAVTTRVVQSADGISFTPSNSTPVSVLFSRPVNLDPNDTSALPTIIPEEEACILKVWDTESLNADNNPLMGVLNNKSSLWQNLLNQFALTRGTTVSPVQRFLREPAIQEDSPALVQIGWFLKGYHVLRATGNGSTSSWVDNDFNSFQTAGLGGSILPSGLGSTSVKFALSWLSSLNLDRMYVNGFVFVKQPQTELIPFVRQVGASSGFGPAFGLGWSAHWKVYVVDPSKFPEVCAEPRVDPPLPTPTEFDGQHRTATSGQLTTSVQDVSIGDKILDTSLAHWMRPVTTRVTANGMRADTGHHIFIDGENVDEHFVPDAAYVPVNSTAMRSSSAGVIEGVLSIPGDTFRTGERTVTISDDPSGDVSNVSSTAKFIFEASGIILQKQEQVLSTRTIEYTSETHIENRLVPVPPPPPPPPVPTPPPPPGTGTCPRGTRPAVRNGVFSCERVASDPIAQTFRVPAEDRDGIFISSIDLFFKAKDATEAFSIEIRPVENGFPSSAVIIPMSKVFVQADAIAIPTNIDDVTSILAAPTRVTWPVPIYLNSDTEYAIVAIANTTKHLLFTTKIGQKVIGTQQIVSSQQDLGSLFKSQNSRTWTSFQNEDLCYILRRATFDISKTARVNFDNEQVAANITVNAMNYNYAVITHDNVSSATSTAKIKDRNTKKLDDNYFAAELKRTVEFDFEKEIDSSTVTSLKTKIELATRSEKVAPLLDLSRNSIITVHNHINDLGLASSFTITAEGSGYDKTNPPVITLVGGGGFGASVKAIISNDGRITGLQLVSPGIRYTSAPTISIPGNATAVYTGLFESDKAFGNAHARYISSIVNLAEEFTTDHLTVLVDINQPLGTFVEVYFRGTSIDDERNIQEASWKLMTGENDNLVSVDPLKFTETKYIAEDVSYTYNGTAFSDLKTYQFKIVLRSLNTSVVPRCHDFRAISTTV